MEKIKLGFKASGEIQLAGYEKFFIGEKVKFPFDVGDDVPTVTRYLSQSCDSGENHAALILAKGEGWKVYLA